MHPRLNWKKHHCLGAVLHVCQYRVGVPIDSVLMSVALPMNMQSCKDCNAMPVGEGAQCMLHE